MSISKSIKLFTKSIFKKNITMHSFKLSYFMEMAIKQAKIAYNNGEVPVGVVIEKNGLVLVENFNQIETSKSPINHAEIIAIQQASNLLNSKYLEDCNIYITLEPCHMCMGAISLSKIKKVIFGAYSKKFGSVEHNGKIINHLSHKPEIYGGIMESQCQNLMESFFKTLRSENFL